MRDRPMLRAARAVDLVGKSFCFDAVADLAGAQAAAPGAERRKPTFKMMAYSGGPMQIALGAGTPVVADLAGVTAIPRVAALLDHNPHAIVGQSTKVTISAAGIHVEGIITGDIEDPESPAGQVVLHARNGFEWPVSIGAAVQEMEYVQAGQKVQVNGRSLAGPLYLARKTVLGEVSFVSFGGDADATSTVAASALIQGERTMDPAFRQWLTDRGQQVDGLTEQQLATLREEYDAELVKLAEVAKETAAVVDNIQEPVTPPIPAPDPVVDPTVTPIQAAAHAAGVRAERTRILAIQAACRGLAPELVGDLSARALQGHLTIDALKTGLLDRVRAARPKAPAAIVRSGPQDARTLEAALCLGYGVGQEKDLLADYGEQTLTEARRFRRLGLRRTIERIAAMGGVDLPVGVDGAWMRAAFSTTNLPGILGNVANKALAQAFLATRQVAPRIARPVSHTNFHAHTVYSLALSGDMEEVGPRGELKHMALSEESWTRQVKTRGAVLTISRQDVINDEMGALTDNAARLGRKAAVSRERATALLINATGAGASHFTAARGNYQEGTATVLALAGLTTGVQLFRDQTGPSGDPVMIEPRILLVPTALEETAKALMDRSAALIAVALGSTTSKSKEPNANVWAGQFEPLVWEWLSKTIGTQAGSATAWYLLAEPNDVAAVEIAYLNGLQEPIVEFFGLDQDVNTLGVSWRAYYDFGVALGEYRAGVKSKGSA